MRRNVTIALDEETARWTRVEAAKQDVSVSRFIADLLRERMSEQDAYDEAKRRFLAVKPKPLRARGQRMPTREELHDRQGLR